MKPHGGIMVLKMQLDIETDNPDLLREFLQHLRDFDVAHPSDEMTVKLLVNRREENPPLAEMEALFDSLTPPFRHKLITPLRGEGERG